MDNHEDDTMDQKKDYVEMSEEDLQARVENPSLVQEDLRAQMRQHAALCAYQERLSRRRRPQPYWNAVVDRTGQTAREIARLSQMRSDRQAVLQSLHRHDRDRELAAESSSRARRETIDLTRDNTPPSLKQEQPIPARVRTVLSLPQQPIDLTDVGYDNIQPWGLQQYYFPEPKTPPKFDEMLALLFSFEELKQGIKSHWGEEFAGKAETLWKEMAQVVDERINNIDDLTAMMEGMDAFGGGSR